MVKQVESEEDLERILADAGNKLVVIDFYATWCGPCKMIAPKIDKMAEQFQETAIFVKVDVDEVEELVEKYEVNVMPTFVLMKMNPGVGMEKQELIEGNKPDELKAAVEKYTQ